MNSSSTFATSTSQTWTISNLRIHLKISCLLSLSNRKNRHFSFSFINNIWMADALAMCRHSEHLPCSRLPILVKYRHLFRWLNILQLLLLTTSKIALCLAYSSKFGTFWIKCAGIFIISWKACFIIKTFSCPWKGLTNLKIIVSCRRRIACI
jgi:hypothetical protein